MVHHSMSVINIISISWGTCSTGLRLMLMQMKK